MFILIKRQVVDNAAYFAVAGLTAVTLAFGIATAVLTEDRTYLSPYTKILLVTSPLLVGIGSCALGLIQARADRISGIAPVLSALPVGRGQIVLAQIVTGVLIILTALILPAVTGTLLWKFCGPPEWLFHPWIADSFIGSSLTAFACYLLGLRVGQKSEAPILALCSLPLTLLLLLLIAIRGFGTPLLVVLIPLLVALSLRCWGPNVGSPLTIISAGIVVF